MKHNYIQEIERRDKKDIIENKFYISLNGVTYNLKKIKLIDRNIFLNGCKFYGEKLNKWYHFNPFYGGNITKEYLRAIKVFELIDKLAGDKLSK